MPDFLAGLALGLLLQISVGPVCIAVLHKGLTQGFRHALAMVCGVAVVDALYILLALVGVSAILQIDVARLAVGLAGVLLLVYFGLRYLRAPPAMARTEQQGSSTFKSFTFGVGLTLTNPLTILFWTGVLGATMSTRHFHQPGGVVYFAAGCVAATLLFLTGVALAGHLLERVLTDRLALWLNRAVGLFLIAFAVKLGLDLFLAA
jgi:threonine/homoserine/homoserine lactone efflux protein